MTLPETPPSTAVFAEDLLDDETVLVTGGGTGIGRAVAVRCAAHGADVAIASRDMDHLAPVAAEIEDHGVGACATTVDVREPARVEAMVATVLEELGEITVLVNNAGALFLSPTADLSPNGWRAVVATILDGTAYCTFEVGEHMIAEGGGSIISMGATNAVRGAPYHAHSGAGKAGVHNLMQTVAAEWAEHGVRANTVAPGVIETAAVAERAGGEDGLPAELLADIPAGRFGTTSDCVPVTLFLASAASAYVTGSLFVVDGGQLLAPLPM